MVDAPERKPVAGLPWCLLVDALWSVLTPHFKEEGHINCLKEEVFPALIRVDLLILNLTLHVPYGHVEFWKPTLLLFFLPTLAFLSQPKKPEMPRGSSAVVRAVRWAKGEQCSACASSCPDKRKMPCGALRLDVAKECNGNPILHLIPSE